MDLDILKKKIAKYKKNNEGRSQKFNKETLTPFRVCAEIVSAIIVGLLIGSAIDKLVGTQSAFKIICLILGCIASFRTIYKLAIPK